MSLYFSFPNGGLGIDDKAEFLRKHSAALAKAAESLPRPGGTEIRLIEDMARLYASFAGALDLLAKSLPYKKGDRVRLVRTPKCDNGWSSSKHFLVVGAVATVHSVSLDYLMRDWSLYLVFDDESWLASSDMDWGDYKGIRRGEVVARKPGERHLFAFNPSFVEPFHHASPVNDHDHGDEQPEAR